MHLRKTKTSKGRIYLAIVDSYYDKQRKMSRSKTVESLGYLDELEKLYEDPVAHFQKRVDELKTEKNAKQAPINFIFYDSDRLCTDDTSLRKNFGYAALSKIYHELEIDKRVFDTCSTLNSLQAAEMRCFFVKFYHFICCTGLYFI